MRLAALSMFQAWVKHGVVSHVLKQHEAKDEMLFYQFYIDSIDCTTEFKEFTSSELGLRWLGFLPQCV